MKFGPFRYLSAGICLAVTWALVFVCLTHGTAYLNYDKDNLTNLAKYRPVYYEQWMVSGGGWPEYNIQYDFSVAAGNIRKMFPGINAVIRLELTFTLGDNYPIITFATGQCNEFQDYRLREGRFPKQRGKNGPEAVIGRSWLPYCETKGGVRCLTIGEITFEICGIADVPDSDCYDNEIYTSFDLLTGDEVKSLFTYGTFLLRIYHEKEEPPITNRTNNGLIISEDFNACGETFYEDNGLDTLGTYSDWLKQSDESQAVAFYRFAAFFFLCAYGMTVLWMKRHRREIAIRRLFGFSAGRILKQLAKEYLFWAAAGFGVSVLLQVLLNKVFERTHIGIYAMHLKDTAALLGVTAVLFAGIGIMFVLKIGTIPPQEAMKRG